MTITKTGDWSKVSIALQSLQKLRPSFIAQMQEDSEPYELTAKVSYDQTKGESPEQTVERRAIISIPTKQFIQNNISFLNEADWERFRQAKLIYEGTEYLVDIVKPKTLVADIWQFFDFYCTEDKKSSLDVPEEEVEPETTGDTDNTEESGADEEGDIYDDY